MHTVEKCMSLVSSQLEYNLTVRAPSYGIHSLTIERNKNNFLTFMNFRINILRECIN